ncbi:MAG: aldose 1-epimerase family protein [Acidobacteriales bacterium]|nr:aldose 1-epimerase family protein [Terriglobales bacterium]
MALFGEAPVPTLGSYERAGAVVLANDKLELTVTIHGASLARLVLEGDPEAVNPFWEPSRMTRELGGQAGFRSGTGHFVCVDGFGMVSDEERAAGLMMHGEAHTRPYDIRRMSREGGAAVVTMEATLPIVQERLTRTMRVVDGENVIYVDSRLENLMGFDRPVNWAEHATVGSPFLASGETVVDVSGTRSMTRTWTEPKRGTEDRRLASGKEFTWPTAPGLNGQPVDMRETPRSPHFVDHLTTLVDPGRKYGWVTALNKAKHLLIGYVFLREEFPWVQHWDSFPATSKLARGLEFSTQPFDVPRREVIGATPLFGAPMYRWLPAKSYIQARFLVFYTRVPEGMTRVDDIKLENRKLTIEDRAADKKIVLRASLGL